MTHSRPRSSNPVAIAAAKWSLSRLFGRSDAKLTTLQRLINRDVIGTGLLLGVTTLVTRSVNISDSAAIQAAINAAASGDTITIPAGTYNLSSPLSIPASASGVTITGAVNNSTIVNFSLSGTDYYGIIFQGGVSSVTIESLNMVSNRGVIGMYSGSGYTDIHIVNNSLQFGGGSTTNGTAIFGIYGAVANLRLQVYSNYFHDSPTSVRDWELWDATDSNFDYNTLYNIVDGGHTCEPQDDVSVSHNYGVHMHRMGQEIQGSTVGTNLLVDSNTFYDWVTPYYDSFGLSVVNHNSTGTVVSNNYLDADIASGSSWGIADSGGVNRFGYAIEAGGEKFTVKNNTIIGNWIAGVVASRLGVYVTDNAKYGPANWGDWIGEPSIDGYGSVVLSDDTVSRSTSGAPQPPSMSMYNPSLDGTPPAVLPTITPGTATVTNDSPTGSTGTTSTGTTSTGTTGTGTSPTGGGTRPVVGQSGGTTTTGSTGTTTTGGGSTTTSTTVNTGVTAEGSTVTGTAIEIDPSADKTTPSGTLGSLSVTPTSGTTATVAWTLPTLTGTNNTTASITSVEVDIESTKGKEHFPSVVYSADVDQAFIIGLHPGWQIDFTVTAYASDGKEYRSGPVTAMFTGSSTATYTTPLWGGINPDKTVTSLETK